MHEYIKGLLIFIFSFISSFLLCELLKKIARKLNLVVHPRAERWHKKPTPLLGGTGIYLSFLLTYLIFLRINGDIVSLILVSSFVFIIGLLDDMFNLSPPTKFLLQLVAALLLINSGYLMEFTRWYAINFFITIFWLVGITNAFNLLDNMDGLSSGISFIATFFFIIFFATLNLVNHLLISCAFAGATLGFLIHNFNPASIFMGDAGSLFIGFFIAGLALSRSFLFTSNIFYVILIPAFILLVPIFDTTFVTITRKIAGKPISEGGKDHTSHRLVSIGLTERETVLVLYTLSILSGALAYTVYRLGLHISIVFIYLTILIFIFVGIYLSRIRLQTEKTSLASKSSLIPILVDITFKKRIFEIIMDITIFILSSYSALLLRFEASVPPFFLEQFIKTLPLLIIVKLLVFYTSGVYSGVWKYYGINDFVRLTQAILISSVIYVTVIALIYRLDGFSRSALIIDSLLCLILLNGVRMSLRILDRILKQRHTTGRKVVIYGAGDGGELILREIFNNKELNLIPVGFIDDDATKIGRKIHGVPVIGDFSSLNKIVTKHNVQDIIISTIKITSSRMSFLTNFCKQHNIRIRKMMIKLED